MCGNHQNWPNRVRDKTSGRVVPTKGFVNAGVKAAAPVAEGDNRGRVTVAVEDNHVSNGGMPPETAEAADVSSKASAAGAAEVKNEAVKMDGSFSGIAKASDFSERNRAAKLAPEPTAAKSEALGVSVPKESRTLGFVSGCRMLNVRERPSADAAIVTILPMGSEVMADCSVSDSGSGFYKICTAAGIEGWCMKQYITLWENNGEKASRVVRDGGVVWRS